MGLDPADRPPGPLRSGTLRFNDLPNASASSIASCDRRAVLRVHPRQEGRPGLVDRLPLPPKMAWKPSPAVSGN